MRIISQRAPTIRLTWCDQHPRPGILLVVHSVYLVLESFSPCLMSEITLYLLGFGLGLHGLLAFGVDEHFALLL